MRINEAKKLLSEIVLYNLSEFERGHSHNKYVVPFFAGDPGVGKTALTRQVAREHDLPYFQTIVAQFDPGELAGLPFMGEKEVTRKVGDEVKTYMETRMIRLRPSYLPDINDDAQKLGIYNLDELPQTMLAGQNIMSQLVNEWRIGEHHISRGITICATGNKPENKAGTVTMPAHLKDRLMYIPIEVHIDDFMAYANQTNKDGSTFVDRRIRAYLRQHSDHLHKFTPGTNASPTPRSWEKASAILSMNLPSNIRAGALAGTVGDGEAVTFEQWLRVEDKMPKVEDIIKDPEGAEVFDNKNADILYLLLASLADKATKGNIGSILKYINRLPNKEFWAVFSSDAFTRDKELLNVREVTEWKMKHASKLVF